MLEMVGIASFICGFLIMFAIHCVVFDHYSNCAEEYIEDLNKQIFDLKNGGIHVSYEEHHTYATPDDVLDLKFNDYLED